MVNEILDKELENTDKNSTPSVQYSFEEYNKHYKEMMEMNIISDGGKWIEEQEQKLKLDGDKFEFTANNVQRKIVKYLGELKFDENMKQDIVDKINNTNDRLDYPSIYQAAALILADSEKGSPYSSFPGKENSGLWVKALLGKRHFEHFIEEKENCIKELEKASYKREKRPLEDMLAFCELDYIIHNVLGANRHLKYFGSCEGSSNQDGITTPSNLILSEKFAEKLRGLYKSGIVRRPDKIN